MNILIIISKKVAQLVLAVFFLSLFVFFISRLAPGDPLLSYYGESVERMSMKEQNKAREKLGLNASLCQQYTTWLKKAVQNDYGISYKYKQPVTKVIGEVYMNTIILGGSAYILTFVFALLLGIFCTLYEDHWLDRIICKLGVITTCIPSFWIALVLILVFSVNLEWLPTSGAYALGQANNIVSRISHLILPLTILTLSHTWYYAYMIRNKLLDEVREDYVLLCKVKGLNKSEIIWRHCLRNIMPAYITIMAISVPHILGGTYVVEKIFSYPGMGTLCFESAKYHDYNMLMVLCLLTGVLVIVANLLAQIICNYFDPRMKQNQEVEME